MSDLPTPESRFLPCDPDPSFVTLHRSVSSAPGTAVILIPPFGWDEISSYRSLRSWANRLAEAGFPALRLSLPATGDSGGSPRDADRLGAWTAAAGTSAAWLREVTGARRVVAVGIGLGGMIACLAAETGAPVDDLVLWATPARGRALVRQLRAFSKLERSQFYEGLGTPPPVPEDELEAGGFVLTAETLAALDGVDLGALTLPALEGRRALLLDRDGLAVDAALRERLEHSGVTVTIGAGDGFADMTSHPQTAGPPLGVIERMIGWLRAAPEIERRRPAAPDGAAPDGAAPADCASPSTTLPTGDDGDAVRETFLTIPASGVRLSAILAEPTAPRGDGLCVVLLNAGAVRRIGPGRIWVEAARRWAAHGTPVLRLDLEAIGDADGDETPYRDDGAFYAASFVPQVLAALDALQARGAGDRFVLGGLCSGAFWSFHAALEDERVCAVMLLNPRALIWTAGLGPGRDLRAFLRQPFSASKIRRLATGPRLRAFVRWLAATPVRLLRRLWTPESESTAAGRRLEADLDRLLSSGKRMLLLFSSHEPLHDELAATGRLARAAAAPNATVEEIAVRDHTIRPGWAQRELHRALDGALARERQLAAVGVAAAVAAE
jgi:dienelactone hydrolase